MSEYNRDNRQWKALGLTMIVKVAVVQALAASGIVSRSGSYIAEELPGSGEETKTGTEAGEVKETFSPDTHNIIDVEVEAAETPAALPPKEVVEYAASDAPYLPDDVGTELCDAIQSVGMTDYEIKAILARRGVNHIYELTLGDARDIIAKLHLIYDQRHAGEILLPDPTPEHDHEQIVVINGAITLNGEVIGIHHDVTGLADPTFDDEFEIADRFRDHEIVAKMRLEYDNRNASPSNIITEVDGNLVNANGEVIGTAQDIADSPSNPPEGYFIQRDHDIAEAHRSWREANERGDFQVATGIIEDITAAYGPQAIADWGLAGSIDPPDPADSFEIPDSTRREERPAPPKRSRKKNT